jgi:hypothetical protein
MNNRVVTQSNSSVTGNNNTVKGDHNRITGNNCTVIGHYNTVTGNNCSIQGNNNRITGNNCSIQGNNNTNRGNGGTVQGNNNSIYGKPKSVSGANNSVNGGSAGMVNSGILNVRNSFNNIRIVNQSDNQDSQDNQDSDSPSSPSSPDSPDSPDPQRAHRVVPPAMLGMSGLRFADSGNVSISGNNFRGVSVFNAGPGVVSLSNAEPIFHRHSSIYIDQIGSDNVAIGRTGPNKPRSLADALKDIKDTETKDEDRKCVICLTNERVIAFQCGHRKTCASCSLELVQTKKPCPMCRVEISSILKIFD